MSLHNSVKVSALSLLSLVLACAVGGCATGTRDPNPTLKPRPVPLSSNPLLEAVPIWVSSSATTAGQSVRVWVAMSADAASTGESIEVVPFILPSPLSPGEKVEDVMDPAQSGLKFKIVAGERVGYTDLLTLKPADLKQPRVLHIGVRETPDSTAVVFGTIVINP